ncbi:RICIN domain-containing protein [Micromonospora sp. NPDC049559]|uniref:RICIN domain-containing protein n=1 Tax=Micromonospora sp. NPDC049559 TaxID=3155923 RepID=UPI003436501F
MRAYGMGPVPGRNQRRRRSARATAVLIAATLAGGLAGTPTPVAAAPTPPPGRAEATPAGPAETPREAPDAATAAATARRTGAPVEITSERSETGRVFANPSGSRTLEEYALPVRTRHGDDWVPVDSRLVRNADGSVTPAATVTGLRLAGGGTDALVSATRDGKSLTLRWPAPLPAPVLDGDTATYPEVLPGVDLVVRVNAVGFSQLLVVKNAAAAANPALRRIRFGLGTQGLALRRTDDGGSVAVDDRGEVVFHSGAPAMWESAADGSDTAADGTAPSGTAAARVAGTGTTTADVEPRRREMRLEIGAGELAVVPDQELLTAPDVRYPLYLDPSYSGVQYRWTMVNSAKKDTSYWTDDYYREDARVGKVYGSSDGPWRTFFQVKVAGLARSTVSRAWFSITMTHTGSCSATSVELWHTATIDPASALTWNNSGSKWLDGKALDTQSGKANKSACAQPPMLMEFGAGNDAVKNVVQQAVSGTAGPQEAVAFGLRIPSASEGDQNYWKRFDEATARLNVEYNTPPLAPTGVSTVPGTPCGTATAPTVLNTPNPVLGGSGYDPNGDNITNELEVLSGETVLTTLTSGTVGSGTAVRWTVPGGVLPSDEPNAVFSYRARTRDGGLAGGYGPRCYFTVDAAAPAPPTISSTDFPGTTPVRAVGEPGTVTLTRSAANTDVTGFRYGFSSDNTSMYIPVRADGTASVPITLWPDTPGDTGNVTRTLYARTVDRAGNASSLSAGWTLTASGRTVGTPGVRGDVNGDRRADFAALVDQGNSRTTAWNFTTGAAGASTGYIGWDAGANGGFPTDRIRSASGDFDGDGRTDIAVFREDSDQQVRLFLLRSDGSRFVSASEPVWTGSGIRLSHFEVVAGDFDADGDDDLAEFQGLAGGQTRLLLQASNRGQFGAPVLQWDSGAGNLPFSRVHAVAGDFDGDGDDDVANVYDAGGQQARVQLHPADLGRLGAPVTRWDSGAGNFAASRARFVAGNVTGDASGADEIIALSDLGNATARLTAIGGTGTTWTATTWWSSASGAFDAGRATIASGDYDGDGRADLGALVDGGAGTWNLYQFTSTGSSFADKQSRWTGPVSDARPAVRVESGRKYLIQPVHSDKCVDVAGASVDNSALINQRSCVVTATSEQFQLEQLGVAPYFRIKSTAGKCLDDNANSLADNTQMIQYTCGTFQPNQHFRIDYVSGTAPDIQVQIRNVHSDKCLQISGASMSDGAALVQVTCSATPPANQQFFLRLEP